MRNLTLKEARDLALSAAVSAQKNMAEVFEKDFVESFPFPIISKTGHVIRCAKHPYYRATRRPNLKTNCQDCERLYTWRKLLGE